MQLDDPRWQTLEGGYRTLIYDASADLRALRAGDETVYESLWQNLHHQNNVGEASYAALVSLVDISDALKTKDWNFYGLANVIEICRHDNNPPLPEWLAFEYHSALRKLLAIALSDIPRIKDAETLKQAFATIALSKGERQLGRLLSELDEDEIEELLRAEVPSRFHSPQGETADQLNQPTYPEI